MKNAIGFIKALMGKTNDPKQIIEQMVGTNDNPVVNNLVQMAQKGDYQGLENFARNIFKERGQDFDKEFADFMSNFK